jgi:Fe-Mn family superoxide dismutase
MIQRLSDSPGASAPYDSGNQIQADFAVSVAHRRRTKRACLAIQPVLFHYFSLIMTPLPSRRDFIALSATAATAVAASVLPSPAAETTAAPAAPAPPTGPFTLAPLPYDKGALLPHIDALTMQIHHGKHHQAYVNGLNTALKSGSEWQKKSLEELIGNIPSLPEALQTPVRNHGGGHWNHTFFWECMNSIEKGGTGGNPDEKKPLGEAIKKSFGKMEDFRKKFTEAATKRFGSGWAWLIYKPDGSLAVVSTPNQDNPLMQGIVPDTDRGVPLLGLDVWEHAYYLTYQNRRPDYIEAWWNLVHWPVVAKRYATAANLPPEKEKDKK